MLVVKKKIYSINLKESKSLQEINCDHDICPNAAVIYLSA